MDQFDAFMNCMVLQSQITSGEHNYVPLVKSMD